MAEEKAPWYKQSHLIRLNLSLILLCFYAASIGYDGSMMNSLQALPNWMDFMDNPESVWLGFINAIYWIAFLVTCPIAAWASNTFGRKRTIYSAYIPLIIGFVLQTTAKSPTDFIIGRVFLGIPSAIWANVAPLLVAECAYPPHRSKLTSLYFCGFHVGAAISAWCAFGTRSYGTSWTWRTVSVCQCLCPVLALPGIFLCSESPRWLFITGQEEKARQILVNTHANGDVSSPEIQAEILEIETTLRQEQMSLVSGGYRGLISTPGNRHRLLITVTLGIFSQWVGNGVVTYYLSMVLNTIGITSVKDQTLISGCLQIWNIILAVTGANLVDRLGRRVLFLLSFALMLTSYAIITACSGSFADSGVKAVGITVIPFLFIFYAGYDIAITPLQVAYPVEIWPYRYRARGLSVAWIAATLALIFNTFVNPIALDIIGWRYYLVFVAVLIVYGVTVFFFYPETKGHTLEQMAAVFDGHEGTSPNQETDDASIVEIDRSAKSV